MYLLFTTYREESINHGNAKAVKKMYCRMYVSSFLANIDMTKCKRQILSKVFLNFS